MLAIATPLVGSVLFLGAVGFQDAIGQWQGQWRSTAIAALVGAAILIGALARLRPWRRLRPCEPDTRPRLVRFASWLLGSAAFAFVLDGVLVLIWGGRRPNPQRAMFLFVLIATVQGLLRWLGPAEKRR